jgi:hypothetical protein
MCRSLEDLSTCWTLGLTSKDISRSGIIVSSPLSFWVGSLMKVVRLFQPALTCTISVLVVSSLKMWSHRRFTVAICCSWFVYGGLWGGTFWDCVQAPLLFLFEGMTS